MNKQSITAKNVRTLPEGVHCLERGVYLRVSKAGRFWILKVQKDGKRREFGLGGVDQTLEGVRAKAAQIRARLAQGIDPTEESKREVVSPRKAPTFAEFYPKALDRIERLRQWRGRRTRDWHEIVLKALPDEFTRTPIDQVRPDDVATALEPYWDKPSGDRRRQILHSVFEIARHEGWIEKSPAAWVGGLDTVLPRHSLLERGRPERHRAAVSAEELGAVLRELQKKDSISAKCVFFGALTACRSQEFREARWDEIDFEAGTLTVPPERRKDKQRAPFVVPLSRQALALLRELPRFSPFVFTYSGHKPLSANVLLETIKEFTDKPITVHGTRSTFSDWCAKNGKNFLVSEKCLMHAVGGAVFMAYQRDDLLEQRRELLQEWADYLLG